MLSSRLIFDFLVCKQTVQQLLVKFVCIVTISVILPFQAQFPFTVVYCLNFSACLTTNYL